MKKFACWMLLLCVSLPARAYTLARFRDDSIKGLRYVAAVGYGLCTHLVSALPLSREVSGPSDDKVISKDKAQRHQKHEKAEPRDNADAQTRLDGIRISLLLTGSMEQQGVSWEGRSDWGCRSAGARAGTEKLSTKRSSMGGESWIILSTYTEYAV